MADHEARSAKAVQRESTDLPLDVYAPPGFERGIHEAWKKIQDAEGPSVFWTEANGGHWVAIRSDLISEVYTDPHRFSSRTMHVPASRMQGNRPIPGSIDPPLHAQYRAALNPHMGPKAIEELTPGIRKLAADLIEGFRGNGKCDFNEEFALEFPLKAFLRYADLPLEDLPYLRNLAEEKVRPVHMQASEVMDALSAYLTPIVTARLKTPEREDLFSRILRGKIEGSPMSLDEGVRFCGQLLVAGLDTVANLLAFTFHYLATHPDLRRRLAAEPEIIPTATEEFIRRFPLVVQAREVAEDTELGGVQLRKGDVIVAPTILHGLDEAIAPNPMQVDFDRGRTPNLTFGQGNHRCAGAFLARAEIEITLTEWFARIPEFELRHPELVASRGGNVSAIDNVHLTWAE